MVKFLVSWFASAAVLVFASRVIPGFVVANFKAALITAIVIGIINGIVVPVLKLLTFPINFLTLGLFSFVISAIGLLIAAAVVPGFAITGFIPALLAAVVIAVANSIIGVLGIRSFA
jgi:putative membrane protein